MKTQLSSGLHGTNFNFLGPIAVLVALVALIVIPLFSSSSASSSKQASRTSQSPAANEVRVTALGSNQRNETAGLFGLLAASDRATLAGGSASTFGRLLPLAIPQSSVDIATYDATCTTPKTTFVLGEVVCAKATGLVGYRFAWVDSAGFILQRTDITTDPQTDTFTLPSTQTSVVNDTTVDNRGEWRVNAITSRGSLKTSAFFTVKDPDNAVVDLSITKSLIGDSPVAGGQAQFAITIKNNGPDDAADVHFLDDTFTGATLSSVTQTDGPSFVCTPGSIADCTLDLFTKGSEAKFLLNFTAGTVGSSLVNTATVSSTTAEQNPADNSFTTAALTVGSGAPPPSCTLDCPENINAIADTEENGQRGTHVTYAAPTTSGDCGTVTTSPASGSFFPVGTTTVVATSEEGNGSCSFTINVTDTGTNPPTISCPANQTGTADSNCTANINVGTATATGTNVTVIGSRSDGQAMYTCDANGTNCTRNSSDFPFPAGVTTITWIAYSHDTPGPYTSADDEEAHRTGAASCTQTVTVNDITPPAITPPANQTGSADEACMFALPDYTTMATVSDNCACASSDESEICDTRTPITITQSPEPGTLVGLGPHTITLTANDGSSNNNGAGNTATAQFTVTVIDTTAPMITCPASITTNNDPGQCSAVVNPGTATATDNCDSSPTIVGTRSDNQPLSAPYPVGPTTITWTATDDTNNQSSCTQTITVNDTELPTISCPVSFTLEPTCPTGAVGNYTTPVGADNCPGAITTRTAGLASGAVFPIGTTTVTYSVTDAAGNGPVSCSFTVTVLTPQAVIQNLINAVNASSLTGQQKNGLLAKLNAALSAINSGQTNIACNKLSEFINNVASLISHGDLTAAQGNAWISSANHVRNTIGCTNLPCS